ncbi:FAD/NAD(P)-binding domain-containing protein [Sparassis crispa]|uniref:FAD/NAD(P)-binding domain-containing protein n=1 Tax=Sparassis crispa TaxID=139825 RepID=A0A401GGV5_9APHY|nr:FAD/NAD(P)-binding domain-containing protein [Sparassis crispa]GBE81426.1 FAD/NAD(P)-binding domain-containing protein [Sparassis crispa]
MSKTKVIIAGCGIAGPVLAIFLKGKGYEPVVYERLEKPTEQGLSMCLQPNGLRVLSLIPGFCAKIVGLQLKNLFFCSSLSEDEGLLAETDAPSMLPELVGPGMCVLGVHRATFCRTLVEEAESHGVQIVWGHQVVGLTQSEDSVELAFANGKTDTASFVVGCDGLHSNTRISLFGEEKADFTGLTQTGGSSPTPKAYLNRPGVTNIYGNGAHMVFYQVNEKQTSWAVTLQEPEAKETWRAMDEERQREFRESRFNKWGFGGGELVSNAKTIVKYGLYDRPELKTWHKDRVVLLGDAAHPTSPHLGQGANQAFEDIYHLVRLLAKHNPSGEAPSTSLLSTIFTEFEQRRIPRTSALVKGARQQGENRVLHGVPACKKRNDAIREMYMDGSTLADSYKQAYSEPFEQGKSEI